LDWATAVQESILNSCYNSDAKNRDVQNGGAQLILLSAIKQTNMFKNYNIHASLCWLLIISPFLKENQM